MKKIIIILITFLLSSNFIFSDPTPGVPNPAERILLIYTNCTQYNVDLKDAYKSALLSLSPAPTIDELLITCGNKNGFYDELVAQYGVTNLRNWCEVFDLRFRDDRNNQGFDGTIWEDVLTYIGPSGQTDWDLFTDFLNSGGHLYLQGEHHDYYCRNTNLIMFINSVANSTIEQKYANVLWGTAPVSQFNSTPDNFNTDCTTLSGSINTNFCGGISLTKLGSARPLVEADFGASGDPDAPGGQSAIIMGYLPPDLKTNGRLVVGWETNAFAENTLKNTTSDNVIKNIYDFLSACYSYEVTKSFTPSYLCVGQSGVFTICYNNTGASVPSVDIWDTIPSVLTVNNINPAPAGGPVSVSGGNLYWWHFAPLPAGANSCITINFTVNSLP